MSTKLILGVDMAKKNFEAAIRFEGSKEDVGKFANDSEGYQALYEQAVSDGKRQRKPGGGRKSKLPTMADKFLFVLY